jgi:outer membrane protein TolC
VCAFPVAALAQVPPPPIPVPNGPPSVLQERPQPNYSGSVPQGQPGALIDLSLRDAIRRGLQFNLGALTNRDLADSARIERRQALSTLLPSVSIGAMQASQQIDLVAFGLAVPGFPPIVGPFGYENLRAYVEQTLYDRSSRMNVKSLEESRKAAAFTADDARNLVVQAVSNAYLSVITEAALADAIQAELDLAQALSDRAVDERQAGTVPGIDVLRAGVQLRTEQQRLLAQKNQVEKAKLTLARAIGLPGGQQFRVSDTLPYSPLETALDQLLQQAYQHRNDIRAAEANVRAAELAVESAKAEHYWPQVVVQGDYGDIGKTLFTSSHGTYSVLAGVRVPVYDGGRSRADTDQAEVVLRTKKQALDDLHGRVDYEVRNAVLDLQSTAQQVAVARNNVELANQTLEQARDRFGAGVTDNIEVVQAQQLLAQANENYIGSLSGHNAAKIALAAALGTAEDEVPQYLGLK